MARRTRTESSDEDVLRISKLPTTAPIFHSETGRKIHTSLETHRKTVLNAAGLSSTIKADSESDYHVVKSSFQSWEAAMRAGWRFHPHLEDRVVLHLPKQVRDRAKTVRPRSTSPLAPARAPAHPRTSRSEQRSVVPLNFRSAEDVLSSLLKVRTEPYYLIPVPDPVPLIDTITKTCLRNGAAEVQYVAEIPVVGKEPEDLVYVAISLMVMQWDKFTKVSEAQQSGETLVMWPHITKVKVLNRIHPSLWILRHSPDFAAGSAAHEQLMELYRCASEAAQQLAADEHLLEVKKKIWRFYQDHTSKKKDSLIATEANGEGNEPSQSESLAFTVTRGIWLYLILVVWTINPAQPQTTPIDGP